MESTMVDVPNEELREDGLNWNPQWYEPLRILAQQVIQRYNITLYDVDELVTIAWMKCASKFPPNAGAEVIYRNRRTICGKMIYAAFGYTRKPSNEGFTIIYAGTMFNDPCAYDPHNERAIALTSALSDPHDYINGVDTIDLIQHLNKSLSPLQQDIVTMLLEGYTQAEICEKHTLHLVEVNRELKKIRARMRSLLNDSEWNY